MTFEVSDFFAPSSFNGSWERGRPLRKHLFIDCKRCHELNKATFDYDDSEQFALSSYWLEVKADSIRGAIGLVERYSDYGAWSLRHRSFIKFSDTGRTLRIGGDEADLAATQSLIDYGYDDPGYPLTLHLMNDHYDQSLLEQLVNNPSWIPSGWHGWFEELPKKLLPAVPEDK
jgi:hypothetical protein